MIWTDHAKQQLRRIFDYIRIDSEFYANQIKNEILNKASQAEYFPYKHRKVPELDDIFYREIFVYFYRIIYEISGENINIITILHTRQKFTGEIK